jgi:hypothetical protein
MALKMLRTLTHTEDSLIYLKGTVEWKMYTAIILSVERLIYSSSANIFHIENSYHFYVRAAVGVGESQYIYLFNKGI